VPEKVKICKIQEAALEYALRASANRSLKQIRAVFIRGPGTHNGLLFGNGGDLQVAIPYDFDLAGIVNAPYAEPDIARASTLAE
jgi:hypothetical protein